CLHLDARLAVPAVAGQPAGQEDDDELAVAAGDDLGAQALLVLVGDVAGVLPLGEEVRAGLVGVGDRVGLLLGEGCAGDEEGGREEQGGERAPAHGRSPGSGCQERASGPDRLRIVGKRPGENEKTASSAYPGVDRSPATGSSTLNVEPFPSSVTTRMAPRCPRTMPSTAANP